MAKNYSQYLTDPNEKKEMEKLESSVADMQKGDNNQPKAKNKNENDGSEPKSIKTLKAEKEAADKAVTDATAALTKAKEDKKEAITDARYHQGTLGLSHQQRRARKKQIQAAKTAKKAYKSSKEALKKAKATRTKAVAALKEAKENYKKLKAELTEKINSIKQQLATQRFIKTAKKVLAKLPPSELNSDKFKDVATFIATHNKSGISLSNPLPKVPSELSLKVNQKAAELGIKTTARVISGVAKTAIKLYGQSSNLGVTILAWATKNAAKPGFLNSLKEFLKDTNSPIYGFLLQAALYVQQHVANRQHTNGNSTHTTSRHGPSMFPSLQPKPALLGPDRDEGR